MSCNVFLGIERSTLVGYSSSGNLCKALRAHSKDSRAVLKPFFHHFLTCAECSVREKKSHLFVLSSGQSRPAQTCISVVHVRYCVFGPRRLIVVTLSLYGPWGLFVFAHSLPVIISFFYHPCVLSNPFKRFHL